MTNIPENGKKLKITDIARLAGVSISAVSAALNNRPQISEATRRHILEIVDRYNFVPQRSARALSSKRSFQIGFLVSNKVTLGLANSYFSTLLSGVSEMCKRYDYHLVVTTYDLTDMTHFMRPANIWRRNVDGLIMAGTTDLKAVRELQAGNTPFIIIDGNYPDDILCLKSDAAGTITNILNYLYDQGHRKIRAPYYYQETFDIYQDALHRLKPDSRRETLQVELEYYEANDEFLAGEALAQRWLQSDRRTFTALVANDQICTGFLRAVLRSGRRCPKDISIVASDSATCCYGAVPLTSPDDRLFQTGSLATELLIQLLENQLALPDVRQALQAAFTPDKLIIRDSSGPAPRLG